MLRIIFLLSILLLRINAEASKSRYGYYVNLKNDTIQIRFKRLNYHSLNLRSIRKGIWYKTQEKKQFYLKPDSVSFVKIYDSVNGDIHIYPLERRRGPKIFALCVAKGRLSLYVSHVTNTSAWILSKYAPTSDVVYYYSLNNAPSVNNGGKPFDTRFWLSYLEDYPDFIKCLGWDRKKRKAKKKDGVICHFWTKNFLELTKMFNEQYP